ncbi:MAG: DUF1007 family protein [Deltaproteobacteria bacterium]|nr:DUF1007 family protein [Deltaproteobacteria bacterium]
MTKQFTFSLAPAKRILWIATTVAVFLGVTSTDDFGHPHVFIDYSIAVMFNDDGLAALKLQKFLG